MTDDADPPVTKTRYFVRCRDGDFVLEVKSDWKLTFGAVNPGGQMHGNDLHCLRVWDGMNTKTSNLRAVFCNVTGFRDLSLPMARKVTRETGSATWTRDDDSSLFEEKREIEREYVADDPQDIPF